jgi:ureidoacrylate peracid hydrolase
MTDIMRHPLCFGGKELLTTLDMQVDPKVAAVLVIDMQNDYIDDRGFLGKQGKNVKRVQDMVQKLNHFINRAREKGVMVIWITQTHSRIDLMPNYLATQIAKKKRADMPFRETDLLVRPGSWGARYYDEVIKPRREELRIVKHTFGGFTDTKLDLYLRAQGKRTIITTGTATNACVQCTALEGWHKGYYSILVSDCVESPDQDLHEAILKNWEGRFGFVSTSSKIMNLWGDGPLKEE